MLDDFLRISFIVLQAHDKTDIYGFILESRVSTSTSQTPLFPAFIYFLILSEFINYKFRHLKLWKLIFWDE